MHQQAAHETTLLCFQVATHGSRGDCGTESPVAVLSRDLFLVTLPLPPPFPGNAVLLALLGLPCRFFFFSSSVAIGGDACPKSGIVVEPASFAASRIILTCSSTSLADARLKSSLAGCSSRSWDDGLRSSAALTSKSLPTPCNA